MKILVPIDASPQTEYTLEFLASRTTLLGSNPTIELLNVQQPLPARACRLVGQEALARYYEDEAEKVFEPARIALKDAPVKERTAVGDPVECIMQAAQDIGADLIVMSSRGQGAIKGLFFGSVSNGVLARSTCRS